MQRRSARTSHGTYQPITMVSYVEGLRVSIKIQIEFAMTDVSFKSPTYPARAAGNLQFPTRKLQCQLGPVIGTCRARTSRARRVYTR